MLLNKRRIAIRECPASQKCPWSFIIVACFSTSTPCTYRRQGSSTECREHLGQGIDLALLHLLDTLTIVLAAVGADTAEVCRARRSISAEVLGRLLTARGTRGLFGDGVELEVLGRLPRPLFTNRRRAKDIANRVWILSTR